MVACLAHDTDAFDVDTSRHECCSHAAMQVRLERIAVDEPFPVGQRLDSPSQCVLLHILMLCLSRQTAACGLALLLTASCALNAERDQSALDTKAKRKTTPGAALFLVANGDSLPDKATVSAWQTALHDERPELYASKHGFFEETTKRFLAHSGGLSREFKHACLSAGLGATLCGRLKAPPVQRVEVGESEARLETLCPAITTMREQGYHPLHVVIAAEARDHAELVELLDGFDAFESDHAWGKRPKNQAACIQEEDRFHLFVNAPSVKPDEFVGGKTHAQSYQASIALSERGWHLGKEGRGTRTTFTFDTGTRATDFLLAPLGKLPPLFVEDHRSALNEALDAELLSAPQDTCAARLSLRRVLRYARSSAFTLRAVSNTWLGSDTKLVNWLSADETLIRPQLDLPLSRFINGLVQKRAAAALTQGINESCKQLKKAYGIGRRIRSDYFPAFTLPIPIQLRSNDTNRLSVWTFSLGWYYRLYKWLTPKPNQNATARKRVVKQVDNHQAVDPWPSEAPSVAPINQSRLSHKEHQNAARRLGMLTVMYLAAQRAQGEEGLRLQTELQRLFKTARFHDHYFHTCFLQGRYLYDPTTTVKSIPISGNRVASGCALEPLPSTAPSHPWYNAAFRAAYFPPSGEMESALTDKLGDGIYFDYRKALRAINAELMP